MMGYATVQNLPRPVHTYEHAKRLHDQSTPIRGRSPEIRPLGARRDASTYHVQMDGDAVQFVLYRTPVIVYYPDNTIEVKTDGWSSISTHQTLSWVLDLKVNGAKARGKTVITMADGSKHIIDNKSSLLLKKEEGMAGSKHLQVINPQKLMGYRINRKRMNEVRSQYSEFTKYMKGFVSLRTYEETRQQYGRTYTHQAISYSVGEAVDLIGREFRVPNAKLSHKGYYLASFNYFLLDKLPNEVGYSSSYNPNVTGLKDLTEHYNKHTPEFLALCRNGQSEDVKHTSFHKAMMILLATEENYGNGWISANDEDLTNVRTIKNPHSIARFEDIIKRYHRHEVLDCIECQANALPDPTYALWMENK